MVGHSVETPEDGHRNALDHHDAGVRRINPRQSGQAQSENFNTGDTALVIDAGKLPQSKCSVFIQNGALVPHATQRGAFSLKLLEVFSGLLA